MKTLRVIPAATTFSDFQFQCGTHWPLQNCFDSAEGLPMGNILVVGRSHLRCFLKYSSIDHQIADNLHMVRTI